MGLQKNKEKTRVIYGMEPNHRLSLFFDIKIICALVGRVEEIWHWAARADAPLWHFHSEIPCWRQHTVI